MTTDAVWRPSNQRCAWNDDGFSAPCDRYEEEHCMYRNADDACNLLHHPFTRLKVRAGQEKRNDS